MRILITILNGGKVMKNSIKKIVGMVLVIAFCIAMLPTQGVQAAGYWADKYLGDGENVNDLEMTGEQLLEAYLGKWDEGYSMETIELSKEKLIFGDNEIKWHYEGTVIKENIALTMEDSFKTEDEKIDSKVQALHFSNADCDYYLYREYYMGDEAITGWIDGYTKSGEFCDRYQLVIKIVGSYIDGEKYTINECLAMAKETVKGDASEDVTPDKPATTDKDKTAGRTVQEGESVYVVKKGDSLWKIAKKLLGKGSRFKELYVRNGDIVENPRVIFPGQEIIIPAK